MKIKDHRRIAMRFEKLACRFLAFIHPSDLRALLNTLFFGAFWFGLAQLGAQKVLFELPEFVPTLCTAAGGTGTLILLAVNLFLPFAHRARGSR